MKIVLLIFTTLVVASCKISVAEGKKRVVSDFGNSVSGLDCGRISCLSAKIKDTNTQIILESQLWSDVSDDESLEKGELPGDEVVKFMKTR